LPGSRYVAGTVLGAERQERDEISAIFSEMTEHQPFVSEWRPFMVSLFDIPTVVVEQARCTDKFVAGWHTPNRISR